MRLLYFKEKSYTPESLKKRRNELVKVFHPDVNKNSDAHEKIKAIYNEYDYIKKNLKEEPKQALPTEKERSHNSIFEHRAAQNIFHALTDSKGVDYTLLMDTIKMIPDEKLKAISIIYFNVYGFNLINHISKLVKDKEKREFITLTIKAATGDLGAIDLIRFMQKFTKWKKYF